MIQSRRSRWLVEQVLTRQVDVGISAARVENENFVAERFTELPLICIMPHDHPLATHKVIRLVAPFAPIELPGSKADHRMGDRRWTLKLNTLFLLMAQYDGRVIVPAEAVCKDYFSHLTITKFLRKVGAGEIDLPLTRAERSQKSAKGVHLRDLASYLDKRREIALSEARAFRAK